MLGVMLICCKPLQAVPPPRVCDSGEKKKKKARLRAAASCYQLPAAVDFITRGWERASKGFLSTEGIFNEEIPVFTRFLQHFQKRV